MAFRQVQLFCSDGGGSRAEAADMTDVGMEELHARGRQSEKQTRGAGGSDVLALGVRGYACQVFDEPAMAWALHQETHLIPWRGDASDKLRVDRFDARNLLEDRALFRQLKKDRRGHHPVAVAAQEPSSGEQKETPQQKLHRLRFGDYAMEFAPPEAPVVANAFPYEYPEDESDEGSDGEAFEPRWDVPTGLQLPKTKKRHAILEATANKVRGRPQLEVMLKVKLSENAKFRFLETSHALHGYYCFLRDENPQAVKPAAPRFCLLGDEYADVSEDENEDDATAAPTSAQDAGSHPARKRSRESSESEDSGRKVRR